MNDVWTIVAGGVNWQAAVPVAACVVLTFTVVTVASLRRRLAGLARRLDAAETDLQRLRGALRQLDAGQRSVTAAQARDSERLGQLELRAASRPYEQAIHMAAEGGSVDGLVRYFGLTDGEAELVRLLHGDSRRTNPSESARIIPRAESSASCG